MTEAFFLLFYDIEAHKWVALENITAADLLD